MFFGPIITLDLVTAARRMRYFIVRVIYAMILLGLLWMNYAASRLGNGEPSIRQVAQFSATFFVTFSAAQLGAILILTPAMIAGCIAQERERKTIEYLFSSTLTNGEIVMSKYIARTVHVAAILVVGLPVLAMTMMLGGVDPELLLMVFLLTVATLIAVAALSIASSVWSKRGRDAVVRTYVLLLGFLILPLLCIPLTFALSGPAAAGGPSPGLGWNALLWLIDKGKAVAEFNPFYVLEFLYAQQYRGIATNMWSWIGHYLEAYLGFSALILAWSTLSIRRVYRKSVSAGAGGSKQRVKWFAELRRRPKLAQRPMVWKELYAETAAINVGRIGRVIIALLFAAAIVPAYWMLIFYTNTRWGGMSRLREEVAEYTVVMTAVLMHGALLIIMVRAAGSITAERERDSWLTLLSTPMTGAEIVWGKIAGSLYSAKWFLVPIGLLWLLTGYLWPEILIILPVMSVIFACVALAVATTGVWFSCWCATSIRAIASAMGVAIFTGGGYMMCCTPLFLIESGGSDDSLILTFSLCTPMLLGLPGVMWVESFQHPYGSMGNEAGYFVVATVIGTVAYFFIGMLVAAATIGNFDALTGRAGRLQEPAPRRPRPPSHPAR